MARVVGVCLFSLAINAVLIQTVVPEESILKTIVRAFAMVAVALAILLNNSRLDVGILLMISYCVALLALAQNPDQLSYIFILVLLIALLSMSEKHLDRLILLSSMMSLALVFLFLALGITQNQVLDFRNRMTFGTNGVPFFYNLVYGAFGMLFLFAFKYKLRLRFLIMLVCVISTTFLYQLTDARGGYYSFLAFTALVILVPWLSRLSVFRFVASVLPVIFIIFSFYTASLADNAAMNELFSGRPLLYENFLQTIDPLDILTSTSVKRFDNADSLVDNSYLHLLVGGGLVACVVFCIVFAKAVLNLFRDERFVEVAFVIATCLYFNSESIMLRMENMFVIYFWYLILRHCRPNFPKGVSGLPS